MKQYRGNQERKYVNLENASRNLGKVTNPHEARQKSKKKRKFGLHENENTVQRINPNCCQERKETTTEQKKMCSLSQSDFRNRRLHWLWVPTLIGSESDVSNFTETVGVLAEFIVESAIQGSI